MPKSVQMRLAAGFDKTAGGFADGGKGLGDVVVPGQVFFVGERPEQAEARGEEAQPGREDAEGTALRIDGEAVKGDQMKICAAHADGFATGDAPEQAVEERHEGEGGGKEGPELFAGAEAAAHGLNNHDDQAEADGDHGGVDGRGDEAVRGGGDGLVAEDLGVNFGFEFAGLRRRRGDEIEHSLFDRGFAGRMFLRRTRGGGMSRGGMSRCGMSRGAVSRRCRGSGGVGLLALPAVKLDDLTAGRLRGSEQRGLEGLFGSFGRADRGGQDRGGCRFREEELLGIESIGQRCHRECVRARIAGGRGNDDAAQPAPAALAAMIVFADRESAMFTLHFQTPSRTLLGFPDVPAFWPFS